VSTSSEGSADTVKTASLRIELCHITNIDVVRSSTIRDAQEAIDATFCIIITAKNRPKPSSTL
jgi:hypothetical protein